MVKNKKCRFTISEFKSLNDRYLLLYSVRNSSIKVFMQCEAWRVPYTLKYIYLYVLTFCYDYSCIHAYFYAREYRLQFKIRTTRTFLDLTSRCRVQKNRIWNLEGYHNEM